MAPRNAGQRAPIEDGDDVNLDDIDTLPHDDDVDDPPPADDDEPPADDGDEPPADDDDEPPADDDDEPPADDVSRRQPERQEARGRGDRRIRTLANENRELKTNLQNIQQRFDDFVRNQDQQRQQQNQETPDQRRQRRALLSPEERAAEDVQESERRINGVLTNAQLQIMDTTDRSAFDLLVRSDPLVRNYQDRVERELTGLRQKGQNATRESILKYLLGDAVLKKRGSKTSKTQRREAQRRVDRERTRPGDTRDDVRAERRSGRRSLEDRLADTPI